MKRTLAATAVLLLAACAQVRELQGGEKDITPPLLLEAEPPNGTTRFDNDRITLRFNERVKLDRVRDRLLISPPLDKAPEVTVNSGEEVVIALRAPLAPNTTYTFNLGEAVADITEGNPAAGLTYVVSTGDVLDSLEAHGTVVDAFTDEPETDVLVILHADTDTAGFTGGRPGYFTRTDKQGRFRLSNLHEGRYRLHALQDQNANLRKDLPNERLAFSDTLIDVQDNAGLVLRMFLPLAATQQVKEATVMPDRAWRLVLARPADSLELLSVDRTGGLLNWTAEWNTSRDTALFWPSDTTLLNGQRFVVRDTTGIVDTLLYRPTRKMPFYNDVRFAGMTDDLPTILCTRPIRRIEQDRVRVIFDSTIIDAGLVDSFLVPDPFHHRKARLTMNFASEVYPVLELFPGAIVDIYGGGNDTLRLPIGTTASAPTGDLTVNLSSDSMAGIPGPLLLRLLNAQGGVVRTEAFPKLPHKAVFIGTPTGVYTLKLTSDKDHDGRWTTGSLVDRRQPERVFRKQGDVNVRAGWEVVVDWSISDR